MFEQSTYYFSCMRLTDRTIGYFTIALALLISGWVIWQMHSKSAEGAGSITVLFSELGSLQPEDAVVERGVHVGHIHSTSLVNGQAEVVIHFDLPVKFCEGTRFINSNYSLMGQRYVVILPEHKGKPLDLQLPIQGEYEAGIAEAMHLVEYAVVALDSIKIAVELLARGTEGKPGFAPQFNSLIGGFDQALTKLHHTVDQQGGQIVQLLAKGNQLAATALDKSVEIQTGLDSAVITSQEALLSLNSAMEATGSGISTFTTELESLIQSKAWEELVEKRDLHDSLVVMVKGLHNLVDLLNGNAQSQFKMSFCKFFKHTNWNIFGATAREKRARRAAQQ